MCGSWNVASASVRGFWPQIRIPIPYSPHMLPTAAVCPIHLSLESLVTEEQLTAAAAEHGHVVTQIEHVRQHYTIASAHCAQWVSLPSDELKLMISVCPHPRIFGGKPSASVRGSQEFLRICVCTPLPQTAVAVGAVRRVARRHFKGHRERPIWHEIEAVAAVSLEYFRRQMTVKIIIA